MSTSQRPNIHGTAVVLGRYGVLLTGASGAGKTTLALRLLEKAAASGLFARLVADDQLFVEAAGSALIVHAPEAIEGLVEAYGLGPSAVLSISTARIDLACNLNGKSPRFQDAGLRQVAGVLLPSLNLGERETEQSVTAILAYLDLNQFAGMRQNGRDRTILSLVK